MHEGIVRFILVYILTLKQIFIKEEEYMVASVLQKKKKKKKKKYIWACTDTFSQLPLFVSLIFSL